MALVPRRRAPDLSVRLAARLLAVALALAPAAASAGVDLAGTWHVLVHYRDAKTANPETERWDDRLWELAPEGDRLRWTEFPIVVFDDETGRFERRAGSGQYARMLHFWTPSGAQLANIAAGLAVNDRGSETKTLRRADGRWTTATRASAGSASVITFQQTWSIDDPEGLPVFTQADVLGSESAESLEGRTQLRTEQVLDGGDRLVGRYDRDGTRTGSFEMRRAGARKALAKKTQAQLHQQGFQRSARVADDVERLVRSTQEALAADGIELDAREKEKLADRAVELLAEGRSPEEARRLLVEAEKASHPKPAR
jgi:hypothetical protein